MLCDFSDNLVLCHMILNFFMNLISNIYNVQGFMIWRISMRCEAGSIKIAKYEIYKVYNE